MIFNSGHHHLSVGVSEEAALSVHDDVTTDHDTMNIDSGNIVSQDVLEQGQ